MQEDAAIEVVDLRFQGLAAGDGTPALLLHGFPDTPYSLGHQVEALAAHGYSAFAPALRGYPPTGGTGPFGIDRLADDAIALLSAMGASPESQALLIGHDWGGIIACAAAAKAPEILDRIVIVSVPHPMIMATKFLAGDYDQLKRSWYMFVFQVPGLAEAVVSANDFAFLERLMLDWSPRLIENEGRDQIDRRKAALSEPAVLAATLGYYRAMFGAEQTSVGPVPVPTLVVFGADDQCISPAICDGMEPLFPAGYRFEVVENAGHFVPSEAPEELSELILAFVGA